MQYALLPKENKGDAVTATFNFRFGSLATLRGQGVAGDYTAEMLDKGTVNKNRQQIKEELNRLKASVNFSGSGSFLTVNVETDRQHLPEVIRLVGEILTKPAFPASEFDKMKAETLAALEEQKSDPNALAANTYSRISQPTYPKDDPRYVRTFEEETTDLKALTVQDVQAFYKKFYGGTTGSTGAIVGDFDKKEVEKAMNEAFGSWKSGGKFERIANDYTPIAAKTEALNTPDKSNAVYVAGYGFPMRNDDPDYPAITIGGYILGGGFLNSRLATRIRQKDGLSYTVRGNFSASSLDKNGSFSAFMIYNPENVDKLETAFREEIERATKDGFTAEELDAARSGWLKSRKVARTSDAALAGTLQSNLYVGRTMAWEKQLDDHVASLT
ncbi:MAG: insulinase family protein, partial [Saprospiraceae bacterium]|nr:insulinase family protein [Saprospiraceae bacterium]